MINYGDEYAIREHSYLEESPNSISVQYRKRIPKFNKRPIKKANLHIQSASKKANPNSISGYQRKRIPKFYKRPIKKANPQLNNIPTK